MYMLTVSTRYLRVISREFFVTVAGGSETELRLESPNTGNLVP
jgi:hypothetical protein